MRNSKEGQEDIRATIARLKGHAAPPPAAKTSLSDAFPISAEKAAVEEAAVKRIKQEALRREEMRQKEKIKKIEEIKRARMSPIDDNYIY